MNRGESGFAVIGVLIIVVSIWIMGTALVFISLSNSKINSVNYQYKQNFYICEGAIEAIKSALPFEVQKAFEMGRDKLNIFIEEEYENFIQNEMEIVKNGGKSPYIKSLEDESGSVDYEEDKDAIDEKFNEIFKYWYAYYFCGSSNRMAFGERIKSIDIERAYIGMKRYPQKIDKDNVEFCAYSTCKSKESQARVDVKVWIRIPDKDCFPKEYFEGDNGNSVNDENDNFEFGDLVEVKEWAKTE